MEACLAPQHGARMRGSLELSGAEPSRGANDQGGMCKHSSVSRHIGACAVVALAALAVSSCGSGSSQSTPSAVLISAYEAVHDGDFTKACSYIDPEAKRLLTLFGSCEGHFADQYPPDTRAAMVNIEIDEQQLDTTADTVVIPESAVTFDGMPSADGDTTVVERDGAWWITF